ncbi:MAG: hypothetical protein ABIY37_06750 [Devosia sp.]
MTALFDEGHANLSLLVPVGGVAASSMYSHLSTFHHTADKSVWQERFAVLALDLLKELEK